jgi:glucokinase
MKAPEIGKRALLGEQDALNSVKLMFSILGTIVSSVILINGAQGGVILSGGITPKLHRIFKESNFEKNLLNKGRRYNYIKDVPIWLTKDNNNGLKGALNAIDNPHYKDKVITK